MSLVLIQLAPVTLLLLSPVPLLAVVNLDLLTQAVLAGNNLLLVLNNRVHSPEALLAAERFETALRDMALKGLELPPDQCNAAAANLLADGLILTTAVREQRQVPNQVQQEVVRRITQVGQICGVP
jgi:hypothetical protein